MQRGARHRAGMEDGETPRCGSIHGPALHRGNQMSAPKLQGEVQKWQEVAKSWGRSPPTR